MKLDEIYVCYENAGKYFKTYNDAWRNHYKSNVKRVNYVFTPTNTLCKNVSILHRCADRYFNNIGCNYVDIRNHEIITQPRLFEF